MSIPFDWYHRIWMSNLSFLVGRIRRYLTGSDSRTLNMTTSNDPLGPCQVFFHAFSVSVNAVRLLTTGWWLGTWILFFHILENVIIPTDELHHFSRWLSHHQPGTLICKIRVAEASCPCSFATWDRWSCPGSPVVAMPWSRRCDENQIGGMVINPIVRDLP